MSIATVVTQGYSISGGNQAGTTTLVRFGYGYQAVVTAGFVSAKDIVMRVPQATVVMRVPVATVTMSSP